MHGGPHRGTGPQPALIIRMRTLSVLSPCPLAAKKEPMTLVAAALSMPILAALFWFASAAVVINRPDTAAIYCILGAGPATICALLKARGKGASVNDQIRIFLGSGVAGVMLPGLLCRLAVWRKYIEPDNDLLTAWEVWAVLGFVLASVGYKFFERFNGFLEGLAYAKLRRWERYFHTGDEADKPPGKPPEIIGPPKM